MNMRQMRDQDMQPQKLSQKISHLQCLPPPKQPLYLPLLLPLLLLLLPPSRPSTTAGNCLKSTMYVLPAI
jgi:hypothetical protein